jgi:CRP/FNR family transcriptional activator FtrB
MLKQTPLFLGLGEADTRLLLKQACIELYSDDELLFCRGTPADRLFLVLDGHVEVFLDENGRKSVLEVAKRPALLGEAALYTDGQYSDGARTIGFAKVVTVPAEAFRMALDNRFDLAQRMLATMSMRLRGLVVQIAELKLKSTAQRVGGFLLGLSDSLDGEAVVRFPYDKRLAAEYLGMTAESLSRALQRLSAVGVQSRADNVVAIADLEQLRDFCIEEDE